MKKIAIMALLCMGIVFLAGCIAEEKTQEAGAGTAGTLSVPVNGDSPARAVNRTPGDNPPA